MPKGYFFSQMVKDGDELNHSIKAKGKLYDNFVKELPEGTKVEVFINIVGNALKFTYPNGEIIMRAYRMGQLVIRIEVVDTGIGIISNDQQYIFQRFSRIENDVHTLKGTGLCLRIVDTILSEHKTNINVVSRSNVGSTFWFDLRVDNDTSPN